jgi:hypothetical protein
MVHYEIPWCIPTAISENFIPNNLIHPVKDGEHICDQFYLFNNEISEFSYTVYYPHKAQWKYKGNIRNCN